MLDEVRYPYGYAHPGPPPLPPELPEGADPNPRWPAWYAPVGLLAAFAMTVFLFVVLGVIAAAAGADVEDTPPVVTIVGTIIQDAILIGTAVFLAARTLRPRAWHFGLRRTRFWPSLGWSAVAMVAFLVLAATYTAVFQPEGEQTVAEDLGADESTLALIAGAFVVIVIAPIAEEFFFRGFFYRALRSRFRVFWAALIDGVVFGAIHFTGPDTLPLLPVLAMLGFVFCLLYERTGSLFTVIGLHALNNSIAYAAATDDSGPVSAALGVTMLAACVLVARASRRGPARPAPAAA